ncbi:MAG: 50S ribosomal protein L19e [Candidatus Woesearchaeota archaeon]|nr:MAG: 50S ribosomal protein L19e [Candidatus Woesearchaeota archaeon]
MNLKLQKKLASKITKVGKNKIKLDQKAGEELKEAITKEDIRSLINEGVIQVKDSKGISRGRARKTHIQKKKGRRRGHGKRKGSKNARTDLKRTWINHVRSQRKLLKGLKTEGKLKEGSYREIYNKIKGNYFRSKRHLILYLKKNNLIKK